MRLCDNCKGTGKDQELTDEQRTAAAMHNPTMPVRPVEVGRDVGSQREPERRTVDLCQLCEYALVSGDLDGFNERHRTSP